MKNPPEVRSVRVKARHSEKKRRSRNMVRYIIYFHVLSSAVCFTRPSVTPAKQSPCSGENRSTLYMIGVALHYPLFKPPPTPTGDR